MITDRPQSITKVLQSLATSPATDAELLRRFAIDRDEAAFYAIVRRHGAIVLDVCNSVLKNRADAEDAFQATFLTLALRANAIRDPSVLAAWLHGTAHRIALKARTAAARRRRHEGRVAPIGESPAIDLTWTEARQAIHDEVQRLPAAERIAIVLCYLQGRPQDETARLLGLSKDGVKKRLERGRKLLRAALSRRGLGTCGVLAIAAPLASPSRVLADSTSELAELVVNSGFGDVPSGVALLIDRGTKMFTKGKILAASIVLAGAFATAIPWNGPDATVTAAPRLPDRKDAPAAVKTEIDGTWKVVAISDNGKDVGSDSFKDMKFTIRNGKLEVSSIPEDKELTWSPQYIHGSTIKVDADTKPKSIDLKLDQAIDKNLTVPGIYQIFKGQLKIGIRTHKAANLPRPAGYATVSGSITAYTLEPVVEKEGAK
jgi:RNA polymerase sigma factor (sigma-70 family)